MMTDEEKPEHLPDYQDRIDNNDEFGGTEERRHLEKRLLRKLDMRMSIMIVIYVLNYV
jgi:hypothetical protein